MSSALLKKEWRAHRSLMTDARRLGLQLNLPAAAGFIVIAVTEKF